MNDELTGQCRLHSFESATSLCRRCGAEYCDDCTVRPFGATKPLCKDCAMMISGVRSHATLAAMPKRQFRLRLKAFERCNSRRVPVEAPIRSLIADETLVAASVPEPAAGIAPPIDWNKPFG